MKNVREEIKMMSVNQISVYHTLLEAILQYVILLLIRGDRM